MSRGQNRGRRVDVPYASSPPILFTFQQTATLSAGYYNFGGVNSPLLKTPFIPQRPILNNTLYLFNTITFAMDVNVTDYQAAIVTLPQFSAYVQADASNPTFREPIVLPQYLLNVPYELSFLGASTANGALPGAISPGGQIAQDTFNKFFGSVTGILQATSNLEGKGSITAIITLSALEIKDNSFIKGYKDQAQIIDAGAPAPRSLV